MRRRNLVIVALSLSLLQGLSGLGFPQVQAPVRVGRWELWEATLKSRRYYFNPFTEVTLLATFHSPSGKQWRVEGFYDGGNTWRVAMEFMKQKPLISMTGCFWWNA